MAKNTSLFGKVSGKIGAVVFSTSGGQTISREYNPHVANPNTQAQIDQRARMKLMSQLSAALNPVIAMTKDGLVSKRNKFVKRNFGFSAASEGQAQISYENIQLTEGNAGFSALSGYKDGEGNALKFSLQIEPAPNISRVVWCIFRKDANASLTFLYSAIANVRDEGIGGPYSGEYFGITMPEDVLSAQNRTFDLVVYAYGMIDNSEQATTQYGNMRVQSATDIATLVANRKLNFSDYSFTQTRGATWYASEEEMGSIDPNKVRLFLTALSTNGTVSGAGQYEIGAQATAQATPKEGYQFVEWRVNGTSKVVSTNNPYTFTINEDTDLIAVFGPRGGL